MPEVNIRQTTASLNTSRVIRYGPVKGILRHCTLHFPPGCNSLVEVFLNMRTEQVLPTPAIGSGARNIGIALDSATQAFRIDAEVDKDIPLELVVNNHDDTEEHTISAILWFEERESVVV